MDNKKIILGIDPGIADTGFGVVEFIDNKYKCLDFGSIKTSSKDDLFCRLEIISLSLEKILNKYKPNLVSVEKIFFNTNAKTALLVGQARGAILLTIIKKRIPIVEFTPLQVKQAVSCYGRADKNQVKKMIKIFLNLKEEPKSDDAADALALAICSTNFL